MFENDNRADPCCRECSRFYFCSHHYEKNGCAKYYQDIEIDEYILKELRDLNEQN